MMRPAAALFGGWGWGGVYVLACKYISVLMLSVPLMVYFAFQCEL